MPRRSMGIGGTASPFLTSGLHSQPGHRGEKKNLLLLPEIEPRLLCRPVTIPADKLLLQLIGTT
jgi:hypothetical protein